MNYNGNMPDWHQYNSPQSGINDVTSTAQNVNSGHLPFISNPTCPTQLNGLNLSSEGLEKHQNDPNFNPRHFQPHLSSNISHGHNATDNNPLASMVQMQNCISHYGASNTRNPMVDNLNGPMDPRNAPIGVINEELGYRNNQVPLNGPISHLNGPNVMNMNAPHAPIGPRNTNVNTHAANRTGPLPGSYMPCKGLCCNPDSNINYQQYSYQNNHASYRENIRSSAGYQTDARRFGSEYNFRKDNFDGKEILSPMVPSTDHRRNFPDFKYRKDRLLSRSYPSSSGMVQNYPMQNYNYTGEYQKYPYNVKDYSKMSTMNVANQGMVKHPEQGFTMPQQKYNKQVPYQTGGAMMPTSIPTSMPSSMPSTSIPNPSMMPSAQNTYFNSQYPRNLTTDATHDCQEAADNASMVNRMQTNATTMHSPSSHSRYQMYQQKITMQRFSMEKHLRELTQIPGYQSHPKYKECVHRYREILKLQQSVAYQGQIQQTPCVAATTVNTSVIPPINLQFDQNGVLINSNYMPEAFSRVQQTVNSQPSMDSPVDKQGKPDGHTIPEMTSCNVQKPEQLVSHQHAAALCAESMQKQDRYLTQKSLDQAQFEAQKRNVSFDNLAGNTNDTVIQQKMSKEFANKPELDVRQFLANWDESEDEDGAGTSLPNAILSESTPVVVVGYENVDLSAKTLENLEISKSAEITPNVITFENQETSDIGVVPAQDCLTIYSSAENVDVAKDPTCKDIVKKTIVRPGSHIIQCISNGPDEVPTIHIVDNLEIGSILQVTNGQVTETLERQDAVSFFQEGTKVEVAAITLDADKFKKTDAGSTSEPTTTEYNAELGNLNNVVAGPSPPKTVESTSQTSRVADHGIAVLSTSSAKDSTRDANLKKQNSFASEESHNPDDISLPDLPTSECTPISTTLNTPIHSDNEESSEHVEDLTIPTNPIEIIQNSPMISFTQSPPKGEPYDHLNGEGKNKPVDSVAGGYQTDNRFKNNSDNNVLGHDAIINTFEFSANNDKNESAKGGKERANLNGISAPASNGDKVFTLDNETETMEATSMRMTLTSGEYELKIVPMGAQNKSTQAYKSLTGERGTNESQAANTDAHKKSPTETNEKVAVWYSDSAKADNTSQNVTNNPDPVELDGNQNDVNYSGRRRASTEMICQTATSRVSLSSTNDTSPRSSRAEDSCTQIAKNNLPTSHSAKHLDSDKLRKLEAFAKEGSPSKKSANNKSTKVDAKDSKSSWQARLADRKKSSSNDQAYCHKKRCLSENTERCGETIIHHNKHTPEAATYKNKSVKNPKGPENSHNKPRVIENISITDSGERMRLLKEYRRIKSKSLNAGEVHDKAKDTQEISDHTANKKSHSSNPDERKASQSSCDDQKNMMSKSSEEQEEKCSNVLKKFVTKNINPDFAIQVTNVNLKLKDDDHQKRLQQEAKSSGSLDAIKIEINVSCTERNTTEKLLHENIKNAVAETIGHLTSSISNGARSNSTSITEIQCDKMICNKAEDRDYETGIKRNRSPSIMETSAYSEAHEDHNNTEMKLKSEITACKEDANNETLSKKRRSSLSEQKLIEDVYENNGTFSNTCVEPPACDVILRDDALSSNINTESELASSTSKTSKSEHATVKKRNLHQETEKKIVATSSCSEELKVSSDNLLCLGTRNVQKKEHQETAVASSCRSARNFQDDTVSKLNAVPSTSSGMVEPSLEGINYDNPVHFDYNHFDVAPNEGTDASDRRSDRWKRKKDDRFSNFDLYETTSGFVNPTFFSADELENLNTVPVYTTKDGKITYSPNPRFTYRELIMEARAKDSYSSSREQYFTRSPSYDYYNCSKLRKIFKRNRDLTLTGRKREIDPVDAKPTAKHIDYLPNKNAAHKSANCAKSRGTSHLEFFNDDADKLYANKSGQESKENKKNIIDLDFLEKQYNLDSEPASSIKHCKTKVFTDNLEYEKGYESSVFDSNLFLEPRVPCWEETMESIKSYSSHIDRRTSDNIKELNFSEIFVAQKQLDLFPFLPTEQDSSDTGNRKNSDVPNEPTLHHTTCDYIEDLRLVRDEDLQCEPSDAVSCNKQDNRSINQNNATADINDEPVSALNRSLSMQNNDEHVKKQESQSDGDKSNTIELTERAQSCSPKVTNEKIGDSEGDQCSTNYDEDKKTSTEDPVENDLFLCTVSPEEDKSNAEVANTKEDFNENSTKVASPSQSNVECKDSLDESKNTETAKESALTSNERDNEIDDLAKDDSDSVVNRETADGQQVLSASTAHKDREETAPTTKSNVSAEISFDQTVERDTGEENQDIRKDFTISKEDESIVSQKPPEDTFVERTLEEDNEQQSSKLEHDEQKAEVSLKDQGNDEVDTCCPLVAPTPVVLNLETEKNVCDLFACERREQNISEFTVIKNIIKGDKKQCQEPETNENLKDCDSIIDSKLLCMDSSDCGIYADRCTLAQMSEHDFVEDDSMVPMVWETSQIQEDAVNRLCSIDESSIDFAGAVHSLQDNSLLDHLSLSKMSATKEAEVAEAINEIESKTIDEIVPSAVDSAATIEESKVTPNSDENKEQNQISSRSYEKIAYLRATDCNANTKMIPKLVIKKSETSSKFVTKMGSSSTTQDGIANKSVCQPKIPKMIIRNARSRPGTPSIEAVHEETQVFAQTNILDRTSFASEDLCESNSESSLQENRSKIPKMKIKLDEKHSNKIVRVDDDAEVCIKRKNVKKIVSKMKIKSTRSDFVDNSVCNNIISQESRDLGKYEEKIPILKLKKQERNRSSSPEIISRKRQSSSYSELPVKRYKKSGRDETAHPIRRSNSSDSTRTSTLEYETKKNPLICLSEKIPKVIIKRTSATAEFKCELSKGCKNVIAKSAKWQPEVKLERYHILDSMVKDLKLTLSPATLRAIDKISANRKDGQEKEGDRKLSRSNSTSNLLPVKFKQRRMSDYDCIKASNASKVDVNFATSPNADRDIKTCTTPKKSASFKDYKSSNKDNKRRSRSRDNNSRSDASNTSPDKETNQSSEKANLQKTTSPCDKHKTDSFDINREQVDTDAISIKFGQKNTLKHPSSSNFKLALKELKTTSKIEICFAKFPDPTETSLEKDNLQTDKKQRKERDDDFFLSKNDSEVVIKKECLSPSDIDNDCTLQDDIDLLKDDSASMLDNFEIVNSSVIKVESSDESQSTIEILPASPGDNHISELERHMEDSDTKRLYSADAIPTQFELELEITDNSNTDLLDVSMPKLDPITCHSSRHTPEETNNQIAELERYNKSETSSRSKDLLGKDKCVAEINNDRSVLENSAGGSVREVSSKAPCCKAAGFAATRENFCCNDSLIKEVLAAKETLKKCLSKSRYDIQSSSIGNARPKTAAEKKQGLSFDVNSLSEVIPSDASQECHSDIAPQKDSTSMANKHKTENISNAEKSDKKHFKQSKSSFVKKKLRSPEENKADSKKTVKDTSECNTISLKTFKQLSQTTSSKSLACTVRLNEKRKNVTSRNDDIPQDPQRKEKNRISSYKIPKISKSTDPGDNTSNAKEIKPKEDNMPILEPEVNVNFNTNVDRETSRSPPVITIQDNEDLDIAESKLIDNKVITSSIKVDSNTKDHKKSEMSIVDLINQLAYHEKATIKHRRYCNLCERWFPTTSRHRRHLAGYQHRHIELTQRRSIHALFTLFTGKPCPRLVPANVVRSNCSVGELTPLQIAVQDVTKCFDRIQESPKKENDVDK